MEVSRRHHNPFGHSSWRDSLYLVPGPATKPGLGRRPLKDRPAPQPPEAKDAKDKRAGRKKAEDGYKKASDRAYKAFNQHEKSRKVPAPLQPETAAAAAEKRRVFRKNYDSTGPHDERYYVSASSGIGTDGSKTETDSSGKEEEGNIFVKLLQNQVLNYNSHSHKVPSPREKSRGGGGEERPRSPAPDYGQPQALAAVRRLPVSKSISSLAVVAGGEGEVEARLVKKMSESSLELSPRTRGDTSPPPAIPLPDYEGDSAAEKRVSRVSSTRQPRDVWGHVERYSGAQGPLLVTTEQRQHKSWVAPTETLKEVIKHRPPVAAVVREITKEREKDKLRQREREMMEREAEREFQGGGGGGGGDEEAQQIYREIISVVASNSPASLQHARGRMVGYGEEAETTLRRARQGRQERQGRQGAGQQVTRLRVSEDRASVTTSIDSYPFSPSSPWAQALPSRYNRYGYPVFPQKPFGLPSPTGPVSFAGFSSPSSQLTSSSLAPASMVQVPHPHHPAPPGRGKMKRRKKWFNIF